MLENGARKILTYLLIEAFGPVSALQNCIEPPARRVSNPPYVNVINVTINTHYAATSHEFRQRWEELDTTSMIEALLLNKEDTSFQDAALR